MLLEEAAVLAEGIGDHLSHVRAINNALIGGVRIWPPSAAPSTGCRTGGTGRAGPLRHWRSPSRRAIRRSSTEPGPRHSIFSDLGWDEQVGEYESTRIHLATLLCDGNDPDGAAAVLDKMGEPEEPSKRCCYIVTHAYIAMHLRRDPDEVRALMARFVEDPSVAPDPGDD